jgi:phage tail sheath protein FI
VKQYVNSIIVAQRKRDCLAIAQSGDVNDYDKLNGIETVDRILEAEDFGYANPSYQALICNWSLINDPTSGRNMWVPNVIFHGAAMARTDVTSNVWNAPAGQIRGIIPALAQRFELTDDEIGVLYDNNINSPKEFIGIGAVIQGQKTAQRKATALDRINVRRTLLYIEATINGFLQPLVLDVNNTAETRLRVFSQINNFLQSVKAAGGLTDAQVICDESNNPPSVIDANTLNVDILVKPVRTVEFIDVNVIVGNSGADFSELRVR